MGAQKLHREGTFVLSQLLVHFPWKKRPHVPAVKLFLLVCVLQFCFHFWCTPKRAANKRKKCGVMQTSVTPGKHQLRRAATKCHFRKFTLSNVYNKNAIIPFTPLGRCYLRLLCG